MLVDFDPKLVVVWPETAHLLPRTTTPVVAMGWVEGVELRLDQLLTTQPATAVECRVHPGDLAVVISSGGTTGLHG